MTVIMGGGFAALVVLAGSLARCQSPRTDTSKPAPQTVTQLSVIAGGVNHIFSDPNDSPVRVVGGSITARAKGGWTCGSPCTSMSASLDRFSMIGARNPNLPEPAWSGVTQNWKIEILDRNARAGAANGVVLCSLSTCSTTGSLTASGPVSLTLEGNSMFYGMQAPQDDPTTVDPGKRFHDMDLAGCLMPLTLGGPPSDQDFCEHMGLIKVTVGSTVFTYGCPDGACIVQIGQ